MRGKHVNIPIFIPHLGCPNTCVFCNQRMISGREAFDLRSVSDTVDAVLSTVDLSVTDVEIAYFGGSFTGIDRDLMRRLLEIADSYCKRGLVRGIRVSTRPDYIDRDVLDILAGFPISAVELGVQSASDCVLTASKRGHTRSDTERAISLLREYGIHCVGQMMIGLPSSTIEDELATARLLISSRVSAVRIYPTVVFRNTALEEMTERGEYTPLTLRDAVLRASEVFALFVRAGTPVIRIGLCANDALVDPDSYRAGPNHPALGELVIGAYYHYEIIRKIKLLAAETKGRTLALSVPPGCTSVVIGQRACYKNQLLQIYGLKRITVCEDERIPPYTVEVQLVTLQNISKG